VNQEFTIYIAFTGACAAFTQVGKEDIERASDELEPGRKKGQFFI
jgi:hypothetical protein